MWSRRLSETNDIAQPKSINFTTANISKSHTHAGIDSGAGVLEITKELTKKREEFYAVPSPMRESYLKKPGLVRRRSPQTLISTMYQE
ncbi:hypothetical protein TNCV_1091551 [Trichonephila clavipes]|nr:hypothetical protein TNCV_1091551 [Trichonephila clavipes]